MEKFLGKYTTQQLEEMDPVKLGEIWESLSDQEQDQMQRLSFKIRGKLTGYSLLLFGQEMAEKNRKAKLKG